MVGGVTNSMHKGGGVLGGFRTGVDALPTNEGIHMHRHRWLQKSEKDHGFI